MEKKVYHLNIGQPDVETPACFMEAVKDFDKKVVAYSESGGETVAAGFAMCRYFERYDIHYDRSENPGRLTADPEGSEHGFHSRYEPW